MKDLDKYIETISKCELITENDVKLVCENLIDILMEESNV